MLHQAPAAPATGSRPPNWLLLSLIARELRHGGRLSVDILVNRLVADPALPVLSDMTDPRVQRSRQLPPCSNRLLADLSHQADLSDL
jgi:hypothetical protein